MEDKQILIEPLVDMAKLTHMYASENAKDGLTDEEYKSSVYESITPVYVEEEF